MGLPRKEQLDELSKQIVDNFEVFKDVFDLELYDDTTKISGCCPCHEGSDNPTAFAMYKNSGRWMCFTHGCHEKYNGTPIGLIRGILTKESGADNDSDEQYPFADTLRFIKERLNLTNEQLSRIRASNASKQTDARKYTPGSNRTGTFLNIDTDRFRNELEECPASYYIDRGFDAKILEKYLVGKSKDGYKQLSGRILVPVFSDDGSKIIGITARIPHEKCLMCSGYHPPNELCPDPQQNPYAFQKWTHNKGLAKTNELYNYWSAAPVANRSKKVILVEGPSEVWRLEEAGIDNAMAIFGSSMNLSQLQKIAKINPKLITTIMDNDEAGIKCAERCRELISSHLPDCKVQSFQPDASDLGDMTPSEIMTFISKSIQE